MPEADYSRAAMATALAEAGLGPGDVVFSHSNIGYFGRPEGGLSSDNAFATVLGAIQDCIGPDGTLVVPTFTYSFSRGRPYDPDHTPSDCGLFTERLRLLPSAMRSDDPNVSVAALGPAASDLVCDLAENAYGPDGFFDRFYRSGGVIANLNFDAGSTFLHYVERCLEVPYRFDKTFRGVVRKNGVEHERTATLWVRNRSSDLTRAAFEPFDAWARDRGLFRRAPVGRGSVGVISARDTFRLVEELLPQHPWLLTRAHVVGASPELGPES